jgi:hypothetical protein
MTHGDGRGRMGQKRVGRPSPVGGGGVGGPAGGSYPGGGGRGVGPPATASAPTYALGLVAVGLVATTPSPTPKRTPHPSNHCNDRRVGGSLVSLIRTGNHHWCRGENTNASNACGPHMVPSGVRNLAGSPHALHRPVVKTTGAGMRIDREIADSRCMGRTAQPAQARFPPAPVGLCSQPAPPTWKGPTPASPHSPIRVGASLLLLNVSGRLEAVDRQTPIGC